MNRTLLACLFASAVCVCLFAQSMDDATALTTAKNQWGTSAFIQRFRKYGDPTWTYQVGCLESSMGRPVFVGSSPVSWDAAFTAASTKPLNCNHIVTPPPPGPRILVASNNVYAVANESLYQPAYDMCMKQPNPSNQFCRIQANQVVTKDAQSRFDKAFATMYGILGPGADQIFSQYNLVLQQTPPASATTPK